MVFNRLNSNRTYPLSAVVMAGSLIAGCAGSSQPETTHPTTASQLNDSRRFSVLMEWDIPLARVNGEPLYVNELSGYEIQYSTEQDDQVHSVRVSDPLQTQMHLNQLAAGNYQFTIAALDEYGRYGQFSTEVYVTLH